MFFAFFPELFSSSFYNKFHGIFATFFSNLVSHSVGIILLYSTRKMSQYIFLGRISNFSLFSFVPYEWLEESCILQGAVHKWRHPFRVEGDQPKGNVTLWAYLVKWVTRGREGSKILKNGWHYLWRAPSTITKAWLKGTRVFINLKWDKTAVKLLGSQPK